MNDHLYDPVTYYGPEYCNHSDMYRQEPSADAGDNTGDYTGGTGDSGLGSGDDTLSEWVPHPPIQVSTKIPGIGVDVCIH